MAIKSFHFQQIAAKVLFKITNKGVERDPIDCPVYFLLRKGSLSYPIRGNSVFPCTMAVARKLTTMEVC